MNALLQDSSADLDYPEENWPFRQSGLTENGNADESPA